MMIKRAVLSQDNLMVSRDATKDGLLITEAFSARYFSSARSRLDWRLFELAMYYVLIPAAGMIRTPPFGRLLRCNGARWLVTS